MTDGTPYFSGLLARQHIDELLREADNDRLVRSGRQSRRQRRRRLMRHAGLRPATAR
jgi:hypothetical protein